MAGKGVIPNVAKQGLNTKAGMKHIYIFPLGLSAILLMANGSIFAATLEHSLYADLLRRHVNYGTVDYAVVQKDHALLDQYLDYGWSLNGE
jgi:hypothetical protein